MKPYNQLMMKLGMTTLLLVFSVAGVVAQTTEPPVQTAPGQQQSQNLRTNPAPDLGFLGLTQDQIQKIRLINAELQNQRQQAGLRLRQARRALADAVESPTPDEALISQRSSEMAEAQAATIRLRSLTEARILQVLTPDQRIRLREVQRNRALLAGQQQQQNGLVGPRQRRRANAPLMAPNQRRVQRQQQKP